MLRQGCPDRRKPFCQFCQDFPVIGESLFQLRLQQLCRCPEPAWALAAHFFLKPPNQGIRYMAHFLYCKVFFLCIGKYLLRKCVLYHLYPDGVGYLRRRIGVLRPHGLIPEYHMDMGVLFLPMHCGRPLKVFPSDAVFLRNRHDMVLNVPLPAFLIL